MGLVGGMMWCWMFDDVVFDIIYNNNNDDNVLVLGCGYAQVIRALP